MPGPCRCTTPRSSLTTLDPWCAQLVAGPRIPDEQERPLAMTTATKKSTTFLHQPHVTIPQSTLFRPQHLRTSPADSVCLSPLSGKILPMDQLTDAERPSRFGYDLFR